MRNVSDQTDHLLEENRESPLERKDLWLLAVPLFTDVDLFACILELPKHLPKIFEVTAVALLGLAPLVSIYTVFLAGHSWRKNKKSGLLAALVLLVPEAIASAVLVSWACIPCTSAHDSGT